VHYEVHESNIASSSPPGGIYLIWFRSPIPVFQMIFTALIRYWQAEIEFVAIIICFENMKIN